MSGRLVVAGCSGTHPAHGRVCSSFLVDDGRTRLVLDLGNGALANLTQLVDLADLHAVVLSHLHPDHWADVIGLSYARRFDPRGLGPLSVYGPDGTAKLLTHHMEEEQAGELLKALPVTEVEAPGGLSLADVELQLFPAVHPAGARSMRLQVGGRVVVYSGDSSGGGDLVACARDADLFVCEATWLHADGPYPSGIHLTGREAGEVAAAAGARRLLITHVSPHADRRAVAAEAAAAYDGPVDLLDDGTEVIW